jgi:hypothetical protein
VVVQLFGDDEEQRNRTLDELRPSRLGVPSREIMHVTWCVWRASFSNLVNADSTFSRLTRIGVYEGSSNGAVKGDVSRSLAFALSGI